MCKKVIRLQISRHRISERVKQILLRNINTHLKVRVRIWLCKIVLFSKKEEWLGALHRGRMLHWRQVSYKSCIWRNLGLQKAARESDVIPYHFSGCSCVDEYNGIIYSSFSTDYLKGISSSVERWMNAGGWKESNIFCHCCLIQGFVQTLGCMQSSFFQCWIYSKLLFFWVSLHVCIAVIWGEELKAKAFSSGDQSVPPCANPKELVFDVLRCRWQS